MFPCCEVTGVPPWLSVFPLFRGHGTYMGEEKLVASVAGAVERVNKLICVKALKTR